MQTKYTLHHTETKDGITLDGLIARPKRKTKSVLLWVHGLTGNFYSGRERLEGIAEALLAKKIAFASFNTRGYDVAASFRKNKGNKRLLAGGGLERFTDCVLDLNAIIVLLKQQGFRRVYLAGHSTGANKVLYYMYKTKNPAVKGLALVAPLSDIAIQKDILGSKFESFLSQAKRHMKAEPHWPLPKEISPKLQSGERYLSLFTPGSPEDVFPYYDPERSWKELKSISIPILVIIGEEDEYLGDWNAKVLTEVFRHNAPKTKSFIGVVIPRAGHSLNTPALGRTLARWIELV